MRMCNADVDPPRAARAPGNAAGDHPRAGAAPPDDPAALPRSAARRRRVRLRAPGGRRRGGHRGGRAATRMVQRFTRVPARYDGGRRPRLHRRRAGPARDRGVARPRHRRRWTTTRLLGVIGFVRDRQDAERAEIGYWVAPRERGRGIASRALALLSRWALEEVRLRAPRPAGGGGEPGSIRVAERCGFVREGRLRAAWYRGARREDMALFSLLPDDVAPAPAALGLRRRAGRRDGGPGVTRRARSGRTASGATTTTPACSGTARTA